jgi:chemotaxis protein methyltransferase CheR
VEGVLSLSRAAAHRATRVAGATVPSAASVSDGMAEADFRAIAAMLRKEAGIVLNSSKRELVYGRLNRRLRALLLPDFAAYRALLEGPDGDTERREMINALTTNLTSFFREPHHFTYLANIVMPELINGTAQHRVRIWSAACSSGEEPYSIAMVMQKALQSKGNWDARVLATDIDSSMVETARSGIYPAERATSIPSEYARTRVRQTGGTVQMPDDLRALITFNQLNLLGPWPMRGQFDVIFCRNVVIYFDKDTQRILFDRMADIMSPGGYLFIGHSETLFRVSERFESLGRTIYRKLK